MPVASCLGSEAQPPRQYASSFARAADQSRSTNSRIPRVITLVFYLSDGRRLTRSSNRPWSPSVEIHSQPDSMAIAAK
jgi:hypothetical protein